MPCNPPSAHQETPPTPAAPSLPKQQDIQTHIAGPGGAQGAARRPGDCARWPDIAPGGLSLARQAARALAIPWPVQWSGRLR